VLFGAGVLHLLPDLVLAASMLGIQGLPTPYLFVAAGVLIPTAIEQTDMGECCGRKPAAATRPARSESTDGILGAGPGASAQVGGNPGAAVKVEDGELVVDLGAPAAEDAESGSLQGSSSARKDEEEDSEDGVVVAPAPRGRGHGHGHASDAALATPVLLAATLGVHSLLEGVGIGVQRELASSLGIVIAVVAHKGFAGFALGQLFLVSGATACGAAPGIITFGLATPIGIVIGVVVNSVLASPWVDVVAVGLACGTFIFVSLVEILIPALETKAAIGAGWRWISFLAGVGAFAGIGYAMQGSEI